MCPPVGNGALRSKTPMLSRPRNPPWKMFLPSASFRFTPREIQHQLVEDTLEKLAITGTLPLLLDLVYPPRGPRVNGRIHITKCPLIGGNLAVRMHVPLAQQEDELLLRKVAIDESERNAMEGEIPRGVPRVFPFIRH